MLRETLSALRFDVTIGEDTQTVSLRPGDLVRFEEKFGRSIMGELDDNGEPQPTKFGLTELMFLSWCGAKRAGMTDLDFDAFVDEDIDVDMADPVPSGRLGKDTSPA